MKIISLFNNKGGVGKTTLAFHLASVLASMDKKVLMIDLDPQCNLTLCGIDENQLAHIWEEEDSYIEDFQSAKNNVKVADFNSTASSVRSIHYILKPTEDGLSDNETLSKPIQLKDNLFLIPGRLTVNQFEMRLSDQWSKLFMGDPYAIRTVTKIRKVAEDYGNSINADIVVIDTSPSLGVLNKVIISTVDGFIVPAFPDMFSLYGIRNIGNSLKAWKQEFDTVYRLISDVKRSTFPSSFVRFLGYTIYNAKRYSGQSRYDLAKAHQNYVDRIPDTINTYISNEVRSHLTEDQVKTPIGETAVMHTHNTWPSMAQKYKCAIWDIPSCGNLEVDDKPTIAANAEKYRSLKDNYVRFANAVLERINTLD